MIEHDVDAAAGRQLARAGREVFGAVVDGGRAERLAAPALVVASRGDDRAGTSVTKEGDRRRPDAAPAAVDERGAARGERAEVRHEEVRERGEEHLGEAAGLLIAHVVGDGKDGSVVDDRLVRVAAARKEGHDTLTDPPSLRRGAELRDLARALEAEDRRRAGRRRIETLALQQVGAIHAGSADANPDVLGTDGRGGDFPDHEHVLVARLPDQDRPHRGALTTAGGRSQSRSP